MGEKAYLVIAKLRTEIETLWRKVEQLKPQAVRELKAEGFTYDDITRILKIGKITAIKIIKNPAIQKVCRKGRR